MPTFVDLYVYVKARLVILFGVCKKKNEFWVAYICGFVILVYYIDKFYFVFVMFPIFNSHYMAN